VLFRSPGDLGQLLLVVGNLMENALWHTPRGGVVRLRSVRDGGSLVIEIVDQGPGIPPEELARVFERFYRGPSAHDGGSGLGLATARAVVERLGGRVTLANRSDRSGIVARVTLPRDEPPAAAAA
jgi:signal transduction histidine kinase